jgi:hypothetical protein
MTRAQGYLYTELWERWMVRRMEQGKDEDKEREKK